MKPYKIVCSECKQEKVVEPLNYRATNTACEECDFAIRATKKQKYLAQIRAFPIEARIEGLESMLYDIIEAVEVINQNMKHMPIL